MDRTPFNSTPQGNLDIQQAYQQAMQNPRAFTEQVRKANPQAYQRAMQIAQSQNPQAAVMQMLQQRGWNPSMFNLGK
jgi:hypothetical protein